MAAGWWRKQAHERKVVFLALLTGLPGVALSLGLLWLGDYSSRLQWTATLVLLVLWLWIASALRERVVRPLQTLSNMLAAFREGDYSIRARGAGTHDPLALAYLEVNALEETLREQRLGAVEATALLRRVLEEIDLAVLAFDRKERLRILNRAGERLLGQSQDRLIGRTASELRLREALTGPTPRTLEISQPGGTGRWELRRTVVRQEGQPLRLLVLSDLSRALREEERLAWMRIVRVLGHEINNSLAPIQSIAGTLRSALEREDRPEDLEEDLTRGLRVISTRAESLGRFMATYAQLARLPAPELAPVEVDAWVRRVAHLETRVPVEVVGGPDVTVLADEDQLEQLVINVLRNAADAAEREEGGVRIRWNVEDGTFRLLVEDEGPGIGETANLFVPFYTTKPGGSGIGLVLSRQIAEAHGGSLELENRSDRKGARVVLTLPLDPGS